MKIVAISDTHNKHDKVVITPCDILIHSGDFSLHGSIVELAQFSEWLKKQPAKHKIVIPGNHDFIAEELPDLCRKTFGESHFLIDQFIEIEGLNIYGSPWVPQYGRWAFMESRNAIRHKWVNIPTDLDILITHGPPKWVLDRTKRGEDVGCRALFERCLEIKPKNHFFGHIHEGYGHIKHESGINFYNAATCDEHYNPVNKPVEIEW